MRDSLIAQKSPLIIAIIWCLFRVFMIQAIDTENLRDDNVN